MSASAVTDLPDPDSPTIASVSPFVDRPGHPVDGPDRAVRPVELGRAGREPGGGASLGFHAPVSDVASVARQPRVERFPANRRPAGFTANTTTLRQMPGEDEDPPGDQDVSATLGHHVAPARDVRRCPGAEKGKDRLDDDGGGAHVGRPCTIKGASVLGMIVDEKDARQLGAERHGRHRRRAGRAR